MLKIIPATPTDAAVIHDIQMRAFAEEGRLSESLLIPPLMEEVSAIELHIRNQTVLTARDGERIIGSARGILSGAVCTIRGVSVEPSYQGQGIGAALLAAVEQAHPSVERFELTTNTLVPGNVAFYERRGYRVTELTRYTDKIVLAQMSKSAELDPPNVDPEGILGTIIIYAKDVQKSAAFYSRHFGFKTSGVVHEGLIELKAANGGADLLLHPASKGVKLGQVGVKLSFHVRDVEAFKLQAASAGLKFGATHQANGYSFANAKDPDKNSISISSRAFRSTANS